MKKILYVISTILVIPCLIYYWSKFNIDRNLSFNESHLILFTIIIILILMVFSICLMLFFDNKKLHDEIISLKLTAENLTNELKDIINKNHYEEKKQIQNNRECILDVEEKLNNVEK